MVWQTCLGSIVIVAMSFSTVRVSQAASPAQAGAATAEATAAAKASPELIGALSKEMGATPEQAAGAAGTLFGVAKSRLKPEDFSQIASAVPGIDSLLKAAPSVGGGAASSPLTQLGSGGTGLATAMSAFSKLGLSQDMIGKAVPVLTSFVTKSGGSKAGSLLAGALK
jgi:hypothetical protein